MRGGLSPISTRFGTARLLDEDASVLEEAEGDASVLEEVDGEADKNEEDSAREDKGESREEEGDKDAKEKEIARGEDRVIEIGAVMALLTPLLLAPLVVRGPLKKMLHGKKKS